MKFVYFIIYLCVVVLQFYDVYVGSVKYDVPVGLALFLVSFVLVGVYVFMWRENFKILFLCFLNLFLFSFIASQDNYFLALRLGLLVVHFWVVREILKSEFK